jgi:hypothetical protein
MMHVIDEHLLDLAANRVRSLSQVTNCTKLLEPVYFMSGLGDSRFDISPDDRRFLLIKPANPNTASPQIIVVQHWDEELRTRLSTK